MIFATPPAQEPAATFPSLVWEDTPCPLCYARHATVLIEAQDPQAGPDGLWFAVVQCDSCGTCFTNPRPDPASIDRFYGSTYAPHQKHHQPHKSRSWNPLKIFKRPRVEKRAVAWHGHGRLLDFGCGSGSYMLRMHQRGWQVTGIDASAKMVDRIRNEYGLTAYVGTLPHLELEPESFDVITMWHSLEHVHAPMPLLREARQLLVPGGKLVVATPNIDSSPFRWFGRHWFGLDLPRHLTHFTPMSLPQMLQRCGFVVEPVSWICHPSWLRQSALLACRQPNALPWQRLLTYRLPARAVAWWCYVAGQADCMMVTAYR